MLKNIINDIIFAEYDQDVLLDLENISNCNNKDICKDSKFCLMTDEEECKLIIPKYNLINKKDNEELYFIKISDELIKK